jgi:thymidylate synthase (FAD)
MKFEPMSVELIDACGTDLSVVNAARVSFEKASDWEAIEGDEHMLGYKDRNLIKYLAKHKHFSPFNHAFITMRMKAPIFVARQLVKHKFMPWNEVSRRYVDSEPTFYMPEGWRMKAENVKQGSADTLVPGSKEWNEAVGYHTKTLLLMYNNMLASGICPEQARMILPQNMMTQWVWSGTLGAWTDMLKLRLDPHTQQETREVAVMCEKVIKPLFPVSLEALVYP